ncbi:hypothetical protein CVD28_01585 [Bacillus sp. M6-12]|uniref:hypothetical protein n=1 Tax=Bacillus sp. M6-12 TaxID=2054166 RepID=UPI000C75BC2A|nr:hypothetical protein [Bacillus sp. M6-12]PLS19125.1 hypothetical protein CVD28_01585 [Bacillus sp. M6-12]
MEKSKVIKKVRELIHDKGLFGDALTIRRAEYAVIMQTFGITWDEVKHPSDSFSWFLEMQRSETDLRQELDSMLKTLNLAKTKGLRWDEKDTKLMIKGFLKGVEFFNQNLSREFSFIAHRNYDVA